MEKVPPKNRDLPRKLIVEVRPFLATQAKRDKRGVAEDPVVACAGFWADLRIGVFFTIGGDEIVAVQVSVTSLMARHS